MCIADVSRSISKWDQNECQAFNRTLSLLG